MSQLKSLSAEAVESFKKSGFAKVDHGIFTATDFEKLKNTAFTIIQNENPTRKSFCIGTVHKKYPELLLWLLSDNMLDVAEDLLGPNIGFWSSSIFFKAPHSTESAYWHKDISGVYRYDLFEDKNLLNFNFALTESTMENGCLMFLPETQHIDFKHDLKVESTDFLTATDAIDPANLNMSRLVYMPLAANECSVHNINVVHGSEANKSGQERVIITIRFFSASARCNIESFLKHKVRPTPYLVRGEDITGSGLKRLDLSV